MPYKLIRFWTINLRCQICMFRHFTNISSIMRELCVRVKHKVYSSWYSAHWSEDVHIANCFSKKQHTHTELIKIFLSLLTLSTANLQEARGPGENGCNVYWNIQIVYKHIASFSSSFLKTFCAVRSHVLIPWIILENLKCEREEM